MASSARLILPISFIVFCGFATLSLLIPTVALHTATTLGFDESIAGLVVGLQSLATILTRGVAGRTSDTLGPHRAVRRGLPLLLVGCILSFISAFVMPVPALGLLLISRIFLGVGESLLLTGAMSWGIARAGAEGSGRVIAWQGLAMFGAMMIGAPVGLFLMENLGFASVVVVAFLISALGFLLASLMAGVVPVPAQRLGLREIVRFIGRYGLVLSCATMPFALLTAFLGMWLTALHWPGKEMALAAFGGGYVLIRLFFADLPAQKGATPIIVSSLAAAFVGQLLVAFAPYPAVTVAGALLSGIGFSLVYPALGLHLVRLAPAGSRGAIIGGFSAFFDAAIGIAGPVGGLIVSGLGYQAVFLIAAGAQLLALLLFFNRKTAS